MTTVINKTCKHINFILFFFLLLTVPSGPPFVSLEVSPESVRGGENINVSCTVLGEPEGDVSFTWSYPGQVGGGTRSA